MAKVRKSPSWHDVARLRHRLDDKLPHDRFLAAVLKGCFRVGRDTLNPLRGNFVASGLREVFGHLLHALAPDAQVRACVWFVQAKDTPTVTRRQRATYIVRAGLPDQFVRDTLVIDVTGPIDALIEQVDALNKSAHVRPNTILSKGADVRRMLHDVLSEIIALLDAASRSRAAVEQAVGSVTSEAVFDNLISETIDELDELSTHTIIDGHYIDDVEVTAIDGREISYRVTGTVEVTLQYGSGSDIRNDLGAVMDDAYPYVATATCKMAAPMKVKGSDLSLSVDNSRFYE